MFFNFNQLLGGFGGFGGGWGGGFGTYDPRVGYNGGGYTYNGYGGMSGNGWRNPAMARAYGRAHETMMARRYGGIGYYGNMGGFGGLGGLIGGAIGGLTQLFSGQGYGGWGGGYGQQGGRFMGYNYPPEHMAESEAQGAGQPRQRAQRPVHKGYDRDEQPEQPQEQPAQPVPPGQPADPRLRMRTGQLDDKVDEQLGKLSKQQVIALQMNLAKKGFGAENDPQYSPIDGVAGAKTKAALLALAAREKLPADQALAGLQQPGGGASRMVTDLPIGGATNVASLDEISAPRLAFNYKQGPDMERG